MESTDALEAEELNNDNAFDRRELLNKLKEMHAAHPDDVGVMWRLTRAAYDVSNLKATSGSEKKKLIYYARDIIQKALDLTKNHVRHHLSSLGDYEGTKVAISNSYVIKSHWETAIQLDPSNAMTYYLLGRWCISIADLMWLERKVAALLFGDPPESSYDEALVFLLKSEEVAPECWKERLLTTTQVYHKIKDNAAAKAWVYKALALPIGLEEDGISHEKAQTLLMKL